MNPSSPSSAPVAAPLVWPTTPLQAGLAALEGLRPDAPYVGQSVIALDGPLDTGALVGAVDRLVAEQPQLHAGIVMDADVAPVQFVEPGLVPVVQVHRTGAGRLDRRVDEVLRDRREESWALDEPPLVRWDLVVAPHGGALLVSAHHAVLDGWSMPLLVSELARHHADLLGLGPAPGTTSDPVRGRYADHLTWLTGRDVATAEAFWAEHLAHAATAPAPRWLGPERTGPDRVLLDLAAPEAADLAARGLTPAALARTCWQLALDAVGGTTATPYAMTVSTRDPAVPHAEELIGLLTDAVLVADPCPADAGVLDAAVLGEQRWRAGAEHRHVGLRGCYRALRSGELAHSLLSVEAAAPNGAFASGPVRFTLGAVRDETHYPLTATVRTAPGRWQLEVVAAAGVRAGTAARVAHAFAALAAASCGSADPTVAAVDVLSPADAALLATAEHRLPPEQRLLADPALDGAADPLLPDAFAATAAATPDRVALVGAGSAGPTSRWTYAQLARAVDTERDRLLERLPETADRWLVALLLPRGVHVVTAVLAAHAAGAAVLVLDPALPAQRREEVLAATGAHLLRTPEGVEVRHDLPRGALRRAVGPDDLAGVVLTSGSTGLPKPVAVAHRGLAALLAHHREHLYPRTTAPGDAPAAVAHTTAFHFDAHLDALLALHAGHPVHVLDEDLYLDPFALAAYLDAEQVGYLDLTPTVWSALLASGAFTSLPRVCVAGGEALPPALWARFRERSEDASTTALNLYGPTEATVDAAWAEVGDHPEPVVGRPLGRTGLLVLDTHLRRVPPGTEGELYLTGPQLAHGYLGRPGATAERFVANPWPRTGTDGRPVREDLRMYRTGDRARWTDDGVLVLGGRTDGQLSLSGRRVEPGEVETVLAADDRVADAAVVLVTSPTGRPRLVAHVVGTGADAAGGTGLEEHLLTLCRRTLPAALVPTRVVVRDAMPLTANGKLDRAALSDVDPNPTAARPTAAPRDEADEPGDLASPAYGAVREQLARLLALRPDDVGPDADFFALGGDSITAIQLASRLRSAGWALAAADVLRLRRLGSVAAATRPLAAERPDAPAEARLTPEQRRELVAHVGLVRPGSTLQAVRPLSPAQLGMFVDAQRWQPDPYRTTTTFRVDHAGAEPDAVAVEAAVAGLFARHESLRIGVWQGDLAEPVAYVLDRVEVPHRVVDARGLDEAGTAEALRRAVEAEQQRTVDAAAARLCGCTWVRVDAVTSYLVLSLHHLLVDGWSTPLLAAGLADQLAGRAGDRAAASTVDDGFARYLGWWDRQDQQAAASLWRTELAGLERPTLVADRPAGDGGAPRPPVVARRTLGRERSRDLRDDLARRGVTAATAFQSAWACVLADVVGRSDVAFLLAAAGRPEAVTGVEASVGMFVTTRPVRVDTALEPDALVASVAATVARTETAAHLGLGRVSRLVGTVADTLVVVESVPAVPVAEGLRVVPLAGTDATTFPVVATAFLAEETVLEVETDPGQTGADAEALLDAWAAALDAVVAGRVPGRTLDPARLARAVPAPVLAAVTAGADPQGDAVGAAGTVAAVMARLLDVADVGVHRSFFDAGGDSILAVRLVGALRAAGLRVGIGAVFAHPTPAGLAVQAQAVAAPGTHGAEPVVGTPALGWYRELLAAGHDGRGLLQLREIPLSPDVAVTALAAVAEELVARHEALRLAVGPATVDVTPPRPQRVALVDPDDLTTELRRLADELDPGAGDLVRWAVTRRHGAPRLLVLAHHLAVDAVSWGILLDELQVLLAGGSLPPAPSWSAWARAQQEAAEQLGPPDAALRTLAPAPPLTRTEPGLGLVGDAARVEVLLDAALSAALVGLGRAGWRVEALLAAALTLDRRDPLVIELEGHGRPTDLAPDDPRSRAEDAGTAVGWFTATWPVRLPGGSGRAGGDRTADHAAATAQALGAGLVTGPDHGLARHLHPELGPLLAGAERACPPQLLLNYLGTAGGEDDGHDPAALETALGTHDRLPVSHPYEVNASLVATSEGPRLLARWQAAGPLTDTLAPLVEAWVADLRRLVAFVHGPAPAVVHDAVGLTPDELAELRARADEETTGGVEAVWPLTPVQQGMVFHARTGADRYTSVLDVGLEGRLDPDRLRSAFTSVLAEHPQLRVRVAWTGTPARPVLVSDSRPALRWEHRQVASAAETQAVADEVGAVGFDLEHGPLLQVTLVSLGSLLGASEHRLLVANHHVLLDGWSVPLLLDAVFDSYADLVAVEPPPARTAVPVARSAFARQLARSVGSAQARGAAAERRRALVGDLVGPVTPLAGDVGEDQHEVSAVTGLLDRAARHQGSTAAVVAAAAWGAVLAGLAGRDAVVTATVVSGRTDPAAEEVIGMLMETVPLVARFTAQTVGDVLATLAGQTAAALAEPSVGLSGPLATGGRGLLLDTLLVVENYPAGRAGPAAARAGLHVHHLDGHDATHYPLALTVEPADAGSGDGGSGTGSTLRLELDPRLLTPQQGATVLDAVLVVVEALTRVDPGTPASHLLDRVRPTLAALAAAWPTLATGSGGTPDADDPRTEPGGAPVEAVREAFGVVLGQPVGAEDNFFALGGDSILAIALVTACRERGLTVSPATVFTAPTPAALAERARPVAVAEPTASARPATRGDPRPDPRPVAPAPLVDLDPRGAAALDALLRNLS